MGADNRFPLSTTQLAVLFLSIPSPQYFFPQNFGILFLSCFIEKARCHYIISFSGFILLSEGTLQHAWFKDTRQREKWIAIRVSLVKVERVHVAF